METGDDDCPGGPKLNLLREQAALNLDLEFIVILFCRFPIGARTLTRPAVRRQVLPPVFIFFFEPFKGERTRKFDGFAIAGRLPASR